MMLILIEGYTADELLGFRVGTAEILGQFRREPNRKLRQLLERRGFVVEEIEGIGSAYHFVHHRSA